MSKIKLIALDLDGTLLNNNKDLSPGNYAALKKAADSGAQIVPTTGRFYGGMPECVRNLPFLNYAITVNGAQVYDIKKDIAVSKAEIPSERALEIMEYMDSFSVIYDCYQDNAGYMTSSMQDNVTAFNSNPHYISMVRTLRKGVPELKAFLKENGRPVQKTQLFTRDAALRSFLLKDMAEKFPDMAITSASPENIEINIKSANKGAAIASLAAYLKIDMSQTASFGDGLNDVSMLKACGVGIAMANAVPEALAAADYVTAANDEDGVAKGIDYLSLL